MKEKNFFKILPLEILRFHLLPFLFFVSKHNYFQIIEQDTEYWTDLGGLSLFSSCVYFHELKRRFFYCSLSGSLAWEYYNNPAFRERVRNTLANPKEQLKISLVPGKKPPSDPLDLQLLRDIDWLSLKAEHSLSFPEDHFLEGVNECDVFFSSSINFNSLSFLKQVKRLSVISSRVFRSLEHQPDFFSEFSQLKTLFIYGLPFFNNIQNKASLEKLTILYCYNLESIGDFPNLKSLDLTSVASLKEISPGLSRLEELNINACPKLILPNEASFYQRLKKLHLYQFDSLFPVHLSLFRNIYNLNLAYFKGSNEDLSLLTNVKILNISHSFNVSDVSPLKNVVSLSIFHCPKIMSVSNLTNLKDLDVSDCFSLVELSWLANLRTLSALFRDGYLFPLQKGLETCQSLETITLNKVKRPDYFLYIFNEPNNFPNLRQVEIKFETNLPVDKVPRLYLSLDSCNAFDPSLKLSENFVWGKFSQSDWLQTVHFQVSYVVSIRIHQCENLASIKLRSSPNKSDKLASFGDLIINKCDSLQKVEIEPNGGKVLISLCQSLESVFAFGHYSNFQIVDCPNAQHCISNK